MNITTLVTGALPAVVILSAGLTALASLVLLRLYRRAVTRAMGVSRNAPVPPALPIPPLTAPGNGRAALLEVVDATQPVESARPGAAAYRDATRSLNRLALAYAAGGLAYSLALTGAWLLIAQGGFVMTRFLWIAVCYFWPAVLAVSLVNPAIRRHVVIGYFVLVAVIAVRALTRNAESTVGQLVYYWLFANGPATILLLAFLHRRVRAVGPLVLAFIFTAITGALILVNLVGSSPGLMRAAVKVGGLFGLGGTGTFVGLNLLGALVFALIGWRMLRWLGWGYEAKRTSSQSITLDALWLLFAVDQTYTMVFEGGVWALTGLVAFAAYKVTVRLGFRFLLPIRMDGPSGPTLLLLRVFSLGKRSERFFDDLSRIWLRDGSINLIAGPDLVTATIEPHEFLSFLGGRLSRQFVSGEPDLRRRLSTLDLRPDPDGNHRVNEFFCRADTWQMTMRLLAERNCAVLMDLRGFSRTQQGCIYELRQLCQGVELDRVVLVIDATTDRAFLEATVREIWRQLDSGSPNAALEPAIIRCYAIQRHGAREMKFVLGTLLGIKPVLGGKARELAAGGSGQFNAPGRR